MSRSHQALRAIAMLAAIAITVPPSFAQTEGKKRPSLEDLPNVVAVVNGSTISRDKLAKDCIRRFGSVVLDNLLNKQLILQACAAKGIVITQQNVNDEIEQTATKFGISTKMFLENLESERDITPEQYASEIVWPMLALRSLAAHQINVSDEEIEKVLQSEYGEKIKVRMIASKTAEQANALHAQVVAAPETFERVATEKSAEAVSASVGGMLPPIRRYGGDDMLEKIAFQLQADQISPVFQVGELHIFLQCIARMPASMPQPQILPAVRQRISDALRDKRLGEAANDIFANLQKASKVTTVYGNPELEKQYPGVAGFINNDGISIDQLAYECIQRHGRQILRGEIDRLLLKQHLDASKKVLIEADMEARIARDADEAGYLLPDGSPDISAWLKSVIEEDGVSIELYREDSVWPRVVQAKLVEDEVEVTQEDLQKGFESNFGPRAEILAIVLSNQRTAESVFAEARKGLTEKHFGELAARYSVEPVSRSNFGKIPAMRRHSGRPTLEQAAFALQAGEMSGIIAWGDQYAILYKQGETTPIVKDFAVVEPELRREIYEKKLRIAMGKRADEIRRSAKIENYLTGSIQTAQSTDKALR